MNSNDENKAELPSIVKYKIVKVYRKTPNNSVYLAKDGKSCLSVIKSIEISKLSEYERKVSKQEVKIIDFLDHPYIIKQKEHFFTKSGDKITLHIVMEYISGGDLAMMIKNQKVKYFSETLLLDWFTQLCLAVKHLHDRKILHRDIKPSNIFIRANGLIKLGDFGLAKCLNNARERAITAIGSPNYLSPEIMLNRPYSFKSDIWAMGVTLFELCALKLPFSTKDLNAIHLTKTIPNVIVRLPRHYSKELKEMIASMLKGDPINRPRVIDLLSLDILKKRILKFLTNEQYKEEFSHTVLKDFVIDKDERKDCDKCLKAKQRKSTLTLVKALPNMGNRDKGDFIENINDVLISNSPHRGTDKNMIKSSKRDNSPNDYFKENDIIQGQKYSNSMILNINSTANLKEFTASPLIKKKIKLVKLNLLPSSEQNLEKKRKEIEDAIGVNLMKDIYLFLVNYQHQTLSTLSPMKTIEENQIYFDIFNHLSEKEYTFAETFKGLSKIDDIWALIQSERSTA